MKKRFSEAQIIGILNEAERGPKVPELCCKYGISDAKYYNCKSRLGGMTVSEVQRLKVLEAENNKLKKLLAKAMFDSAALKDVEHWFVSTSHARPVI